MMRGGRFYVCAVVVSLVLIQTLTMSSGTKLRYGFYSESCPAAESIVGDIMKKALLREPRSVASVMRFQFHDCFVQGCDASMLLDDTPSMAGEKQSLSNINSLRSYEVIDEAKAALESACPGTVSCADVIIMAARDAVSLTGGPRWEVKLGRLDSLSAYHNLSDDVMPSPRSNATSLLTLFRRFRLSAADLVALSGSHSVGAARCFSVMFRLYGGKKSDLNDMDPSFRAELTRLCPVSVDQNVTGPMDSTPRVFDNRYFKDLVAGRGFLNSDQTLYTWHETRPWVERFSRDEGEFFEAFAAAMVKMGDLRSGKPGEIRTHCRRTNNYKNHDDDHDDDHHSLSSCCELLIIDR